MRYLLSLVCVLALGVMPMVGCTDDGGAGGDGGTGGMAGSGGVGGTGGIGGNGGTGGDGGTGGMPECTSPEDCDDDNECTDDSCEMPSGLCQNTPVDDGTLCSTGVCREGACVAAFACTEAGIREAIAAGGGPHYFACDGQTVVTTEAEIVIDNDVILDGLGNLIVHGSDDHRVFSVAVSIPAELRGFSVRGGNADFGGGMLNQGILTLTNSTVSGNAATVGGGIENLTGLTLAGSTVSGNAATHQGGGIFSIGEVTLTNSTVSGNTANNQGGGIYNFPASGRQLTLTNSTVSGNSASEGGGIYNYLELSSVTLTNSTVSGNTANISGGGIYTSARGGTNPVMVTLANSTVSGNSAGSQGGGIYNEFLVARVGPASLTLTNSTVSGNAVNLSGGGIYNDPDFELALKNTTVSGNTAGGASAILNAGAATLMNSLVDGDCGGSITSNGYNLESPGSTCGFNQTGDQSGVTEAQLNLGPLTDNGGPTLTHKPGDGGFDAGSSAAIDQIPEADCEVDTDQRGEPRPETGGTDCDVGAVEAQP